MTSRADFLSSLVGRPWSSFYSCWHLVRDVERILFDRDLPDVEVPLAPTWRWMMNAIDSHPERNLWIEKPQPENGPISAADGSVVLMARSDRPVHIGVWLLPEQRIIHADQGIGVILEPPVLARAVGGWMKLRFYEPL